MKKIFMLLLMAVAAVSAWGQEGNETDDVAALKKKYINFLFGSDENKFPDFNLLGWWGEKAIVSIYDEKRGFVITLEHMPQSLVLERFQTDVLSAKTKLEGGVISSSGVFKSAENIDCCLAICGKGCNYTFAKF